MRHLVFLLIGLISFNAQAQTTGEIIDNYLENIGGKEAISKIEGMTFQANMKMQGMDIPIYFIQLKDGRQMSEATVQGQSIKQGVFDGSVLWNTNIMTKKAEASDTETTENFKLEINDFITPFLNYNEKGYQVELVGKETIEGTETFKIKLTKEPVTVDGKEEPSIVFYYFDTENFVPIVVESNISMGPAKGKVSQTKLSDYQEVDGIYFPFSTEVGVKGLPGGQTITLQSLSLNPEVDDAIFKMPEEEATSDK
ncbi:MAG: outer membrane lipoprotein-sorting protein [Flavobacteriaceae bacterium]|nr:outer membrane lipoprotein-sorting protein [Flavobacteriaceae bacterium]